MDSPASGPQVGAIIVALVNSIISAGILGIPVLLELVGIFPVLLLLGVMGYFSYQSMAILFRLALRHGVYGYAELTQKLFGPRTARWVLVALMMDSWSTVFIYLIILRDTLPVLVAILIDDNAWDYWNLEGYIVLAMALLVVYPLSLPKTLVCFEKTSWYSVFYLLFLFGYTIYGYTQRDPAVADSEDPVLWRWSLNGFTATSVLAFAYSTHSMVITMVMDLAANRPKKQRKRTVRMTMAAAVMLVGVLYTSYAFLVYFTFVRNLESNALANYDDSDTWTRLIFGVIGVEVSLSMPLLVIATRNFWVVFRRGRLVHEGLHWRMVQTLVIVSTAAALALAVPELITGLAIVGGLTSASISYIIPGTLAIKQRVRVKTGYALVVLGAMIMVIAIAVEIWALVDPDSVGRN